MELFEHLALGFGVAFTPINLLYCLLGCILGTLIGVLPGIARWPRLPCCCRPPTRCRRCRR